MKRFGYARDPVCYLACAGYAVNRWCVPEALKTAFLRHHFNDFLFIPAALPLMLWWERRLGLRASDGPPRWSEVGLHLVVWSLAAEVVGPQLFARATADAWDVVAYSAGALAAMLVWRGV